LEDVPDFSRAMKNAICDLVARAEHLRRARPLIAGRQGLRTALCDPNHSPSCV